MLGAMKNRNCCDENNLTKKDITQKTVHLPNFIAISTDFNESASEDPCDQKWLELRKASLSADERNVDLLNEREKSRDEIRWQVKPLIEARIFRCQ